MLSIYADAFMTATRTDKVRLHELPPAAGQKRRWFKMRPTVEVDLSKI